MVQKKVIPQETGEKRKKNKKKTQIDSKPATKILNIKCKE